MSDSNTPETVPSKAIQVQGVDPRWKRVEDALDVITYEVGLQSGELRKQARKLGARLDEVLAELKQNMVIGDEEAGE